MLDTIPRRPTRTPIALAIILFSSVWIGLIASALERRAAINAQAAVVER